MKHAALELLLVGTSHAVASAGVRERLHVDLDELYATLARLVRGRLVEEALPLATCGRLELYLVTHDSARALEVLRTLVRRHSGVTRTELAESTFQRCGPDVVRHLFRVAAGLDSVIHGEAQVLGQVRDALHHPATAETAGPWLHRLFQAAISAGKRVRTETEIGRGAVSLAGTALASLRRRAGSLDGMSAVVLGAGDTGSLIARLLRKQRVGRLVVVNRTLERARELAAEVGGEAAGLDDLPDLLADADIVVGTVAEREGLVTAATLSAASPGAAAPASATVAAAGAGSRAPAVPAADGTAATSAPTTPAAGNGRSRYFLDLAHPRNFDPDLEGVAGVHLMDLEQVFRRVEKARRARASQVPLAEAIVDEETGEFESWMRSRGSVDVLRAIREHVLDLARDEAVRHSRGLGEEEREAMRRFARSLARTLLHEPTVAIRSADPSSAQGRLLLDSAAALFGLRNGEAERTEARERDSGA